MYFKLFVLFYVGFVVVVVGGGICFWLQNLLLKQIPALPYEPFVVV